MILSFLLALVQADPASGGVRITRVSDPTVVCMVTAVSENDKQAGPLGSFGKPSVKRDGPVTRVTWKRAYQRTRPVKVTCEANTETRQITSIVVAGKQILTEPQVY